MGEENVYDRNERNGKENDGNFFRNLFGKKNYLDILMWICTVLAVVVIVIAILLFGRFAKTYQEGKAGENCYTDTLTVVNCEYTGSEVWIKEEVPAYIEFTNRKVLSEDGVPVIWMGPDNEPHVLAVNQSCMILTYGALESKWQSYIYGYTVPDDLEALGVKIVQGGPDPDDLTYVAGDYRVNMPLTFSEIQTAQEICIAYIKSLQDQVESELAEMDAIMKEKSDEFVSMWKQPDDL